MRPIFALAGLVALLLSSLSAASPVSAVGNCQFVFGFKTLHDTMPNIVGDCLTNESHNGLTGDGLQQTTRGLLVWRKVDNSMAFTDGYHTWVNGPNGMQSRLNSQRFPWEHDADTHHPEHVGPIAPGSGTLGSTAQPHDQDHRHDQDHSGVPGMHH